MNLGGESYIKVGDGNKLVKKGEIGSQPSIPHKIKKRPKKMKKSALFPNKSYNIASKNPNLTIEGVQYIKNGKSLILKKKNLTKRFSEKK